LPLSRSTPNFRFDAPARATPAAEQLPVAIDADAERLVAAILHDEPVVLFSLEWCEFCWSVRKLFAALGIAYRSVDLDSVEYQVNDLGGKIRAVLAEQTGARTIPQIFVGGAHVGGCTELFDAWRDGSMQRRLEQNGVAYDVDAKVDPYALLPKWLHTRKTA
jgi:cysteine synthase A